MIVFLDCCCLRAKYLHRCRPLEDLLLLQPLPFVLDFDFRDMGRGDDRMKRRIDSISFNVLYAGEM
jgi:hypothetical protein